MSRNACVLGGGVGGGVGGGGGAAAVVDGGGGGVCARATSVDASRVARMTTTANATTARHLARGGGRVITHGRRAMVWPFWF